MIGSMLPGRQSVTLPGGRVALRDLPGPAGAPAVVLLHGLGISADATYASCYRSLSSRYRVLAFDQRGHGDGIRSRRPFRLEDCAHDVAAMADAVGLDRFVAVGYSMGGAIAQWLCRLHPDRLSGVVLAATATEFSSTAIERVNFLGLGGLAAVARLTPSTLQRTIADRLLRARREGWAGWALEQTAKNDWRSVIEAGVALGRFHSSDWIRTIEIPASVVVTTNDSLVPTRRQRRLAALLPDVAVFNHDADHDAVAASPTFPATLVEAIDSVIARAS